MSLAINSMKKLQAKACDREFWKEHEDTEGANTSESQVALPRYGSFTSDNVYRALLQMILNPGGVLAAPTLEAEAAVMNLMLAKQVLHVHKRAPAFFRNTSSKCQGYSAAVRSHEDDPGCMHQCCSQAQVVASSQEHWSYYRVFTAPAAVRVSGKEDPACRRE
ncbi:hypothetical protein BDZ91DRAFT_762821 [Kalaharituber pfeilii]|nr:hypothetical protein BDZ91DRAFT_762821 [Kalaharituber pfeilii]